MPLMAFSGNAQVHDVGPPVQGIDGNLKFCCQFFPDVGRTVVCFANKTHKGEVVRTETLLFYEFGQLEQGGRRSKEGSDTKIQYGFDLQRLRTEMTVAPRVSAACCSDRVLPESQDVGTIMNTEVMVM